MLARLLILLGMSVSLAVSVPAAASAAPAASKAEETIIKKKKAAAAKKAKAKQAAKQKAKGKKVAKADAKKKPAKEEAKKDEPKGLFATLFGGPVKSKEEKAKATKASARIVKSDTKTKTTKTAKAEVAAPKKLAPLAPIAVAPVALTMEQQDVLANGNNGELRSDNIQGGGIMASLFGAEDQMLSETRALDAAQRAKNAAKGKKAFVVAEKYMPQTVEFSGYPTGTIVIDTDNHFLYLVQSGNTARRYGIAVGKDGLKYKGTVTVGDKQEWPRWIPTKEMQEREPKKYGKYAEGMPGGGQNPLGARAIYLYEGKQDTHLRIHGTIAPQSIGTDSSNGCFRMVNEHVMDLYRRVRVGTNVVVL